MRRRIPLTNPDNAKSSEGDFFILSEHEVKEQRRTLWILGLGIVLAGSLELSGRCLYAAYDFPYSITGMLTLAALAAWGGTSFYAIRHLNSSWLVTGLVTFGASAITFSQAVSMLEYFNLEGFSNIMDRLTALNIILEEGFFVLGLLSLFTGFYASIFETHRSNLSMEAKQRQLLSEIEERVRAQEVLKRTEQTLRTLISFNPESLLLVDADYRVLVANGVAASRLGMHPEDLEGKDILSLGTPEIIEMTRTCFEKASTTSHLCRFEVKRFDRFYDCYICPVTGEDGRVLRYAVMDIDITEHKRMEEELRQFNLSLEHCVQERTNELRETNDRLLDAVTLNRNLITVSPLATFGFKVSGGCVTANESAARFIGVTPDTISDLDFRRSEAFRHMGLTDLLESALSADAPLSGESSCKRDSGEDIWFEYYISLFTSADEEHLLLIVNDVSERMRARQVIEEQRHKMENAARLSTLGMMSSGIAHEVKAPLAVISVGAQQMQHLVGEEHPDKKMLQNVVSIILRNVERITDIITTLRNLSREGSDDPFTTAPANRIVKEAVDLCRHRFIKSGISLLLPEKSDIALECRPSQLAQVLINLINNAHDAVEHLEDRWVSVELRESAGEVFFSVTDSGMRPEGEVCDKLFQPFFTTKADGKGVGIGLNISRRIVESHEGIFEIDRSSQNTRFVFRIPKHQGSRGQINTDISDNN